MNHYIKNNQPMTLENCIIVCPRTITGTPKYMPEKFNTIEDWMKKCSVFKTEIRTNPQMVLTIRNNRLIEIQQISLDLKNCPLDSKFSDILITRWASLWWINNGWLYGPTDYYLSKGYQLHNEGTNPRKTKVDLLIHFENYPERLPLGQTKMQGTEPSNKKL